MHRNRASREEREGREQTSSNTPLFRLYLSRPMNANLPFKLPIGNRIRTNATKLRKNHFEIICFSNGII